jgi:hypothetical protein
MLPKNGKGIYLEEVQSLAKGRGHGQVRVQVQTAHQKDAAAVAAAAVDHAENGCFVYQRERKALLCRDRERIREEKGGVWLILVGRGWENACVRNNEARSDNRTMDRTSAWAIYRLRKSSCTRRNGRRTTKKKLQQEQREGEERVGANKKKERNETK